MPTYKVTSDQLKEILNFPENNTAKWSYVKECIEKDTIHETHPSFEDGIFVDLHPDNRTLYDITAFYKDHIFVLDLNQPIINMYFTPRHPPTVFKQYPPGDNNANTERP